MGEFYGLQTRQLTSRFLTVEYLETAGPRIVRLKYKGSANLFAELPNKTVPTPYGTLHLWGGHRLWHAPEAMPRTYLPDDNVAVADLPDGVLLDGEIEAATGIRKSIQIRMDPEYPAVVITHTLANEGLWLVELAPWSVTMCRSGGTVILPMAVENQGTDGLLPNRHLSLWSYTHINDPRLRLEDGFILVEAKRGLAPLKIGTFAPQGWIAYWIDGILFRKSFDVSPDLTYPDYGCNVETYCAEDYIELESLAPLQKIAPGESVSFTETWELFDSLEQPFLPERAITLLK